MAQKKAKAPRNRTVELSRIEAALYISQALQPQTKLCLKEAENQVILADCLKAMDLLPDNCVDLMVVDPPYNLTQKFSTRHFREMEAEEYIKWLDEWLKKTVRLLKDNASIYICSDWKTSLFIPEVAAKYFILQNRISWEREKGRGALNNWKNCLEDIWFFTKSKEYTFNIDAVKIQRPVLAPYKDKKGNPKDWQEEDGEKLRLTSPSNVWTDITVPFWSMPENTNHPTQKPEKLIAKLILASSNAGDLVFDPFLGSGTTAVTAKKLNRKFIGIEREKEYAAIALKRLDMADDNPEIQGFEDGVFKSRNFQR